MAKSSTNKPTDKLTETVDELWQFSSGLSRSLNLLHWIGYGFLALTLFDLVEIFVPSRFMNPVWEMQMLGALVEQAPVPLIGLALVFLGEPNLRARWERPILKFLSWSALLLAVLFFLLIPLGLLNTVRLDRQIDKEISAQLDRDIAQFQQVKSQLELVQTQEELEKLVSRLDSQALAQEVKNAPQLEEAKKQVASSIAIAQRKITVETEETQASRQLTLIKRSVKWNLGALICGVLFLLTWQATYWARLL